MILVATAMSANAANEAKMNVLNSIEIDSLKDTYNITLDTKSEANMKRTIQSSNNMILTLKNIKPSKSLNTIYKKYQQLREKLRACEAWVVEDKAFSCQQHILHLQQLEYLNASVKQFKLNSYFAINI